MIEIIKGQELKLYFKTLNNLEKNVGCIVQEVLDDRILLGITDEVLNYAEFLEEGCELIVRIFDAGGIIIFSTIILDSPLGGDFVIEYPNKSVKIQRRQYPRAEIDMKIIIERKNANNIITRFIDLGGGGLRFFYEGIFKPEEKLTLLLYLPKQIKSIRVDGIILKKEYLSKNEHILVFTNINTADRELIIKQCFELQRV
jgi:c-di-GMP-binding flagellar brake protein YcgR